MFETLNLWEQLYAKQLNANSTTQAIGWSWLISGFGDEKIEYSRLLPVVNSENKITVSDGYNKPTEETLVVLSRLLELDRVPRKVMLGLISSKVLANI